MSLKCTYGDLDKLRDFPGRAGPLSKLMTASRLSTVDKFRVMRLTKAINDQLGAYVKSLVELGKKFGTETKTNDSVSWSIKPEHNEEYLAEKRALDAVECELAISPLPTTAVDGTDLTPLDLALLGPFVELPKDL